MDVDVLPFVGAVHRRARSTVPNLIVLHDGETNEGDTAAEGMAAFFASGNTTGSAHICVDNNSAIRCAYDNERVNGAGGVNDIGLHLEQAGRAGQSDGEWDDAYSRGVVENAAAVCSGWIAKFPHIRPVYLDSAALARGERNGITLHREVSLVFAGNDGHWDPGPNYPVGRLLELIGGASTSTGDEMRGILRTDSKGAVWFVTGNTKSYVKSPEVLGVIQFLAKDWCVGGDGSVKPAADSYLDALVEVSDTRGLLVRLGQFIARLFPKKAERAGGAPEA